MIRYQMNLGGKVFDFKFEIKFFYDSDEGINSDDLMSNED